MAEQPKRGADGAKERSLMRAIGMLGVFVLALVTSGAAQTSMKRDLVFVTRGDCPSTPDLANHLDAALKALGWGTDYQILDSKALKPTDPRVGYPTPTILWK